VGGGQGPKDVGEETAPAILEIGILLLAAAALGWTARRLGLPAVAGYLALGLAVLVSRVPLPTDAAPAVG
jgi:Kef-type K+ transport system membrane component KefB